MRSETDNEVAFEQVSERLNYHLQTLLANDGAVSDKPTPES